MQGLQDRHVVLYSLLSYPKQVTWPSPLPAHGEIAFFSVVRCTSKTLAEGTDTERVKTQASNKLQHRQ